MLSDVLVTDKYITRDYHQRLGSGLADIKTLSVYDLTAERTG